MISKRLLDIASLIPRGKPLYDVGTDHGYLPVYEVGNSEVPFAVASDVAEGPLKKAQLNIRGSGYSDRIKTVLSDGLDSVPVESPCTVAMCGMGGELIIRIIARKRELFSEGVSLVLQPMTKEDLLRRFLTENGFEIKRELVSDDGRLYQIIYAEYTGKRYMLSDFEATCGVNQTDIAAFALLLERKSEQLKAVTEGKKAAGLDTAGEERLISESEAILENFRTV